MASYKAQHRVPQIEHNLAAAARLYDNIFLSELGTLLGVDGDKAEGIASKMIVEGRLKVDPPHCRLCAPPGEHVARDCACYFSAVF